MVSFTIQYTSKKQIETPVKPLNPANSPPVDYFKELCDLMITEVKNLIALNLGVTIGLILRHCKDRYLEVIDQLSSYPNIQYKFLQQLIVQDARKFENLSDGIKLAFLENMCNIDPYKIPKILLAHKFPLSESLAICKRYCVPQGEMIIQALNGKFDEALQLLTGLLEDKKYFKGGLKRYDYYARNLGYLE